MTTHRTRITRFCRTWIALAPLLTAALGGPAPARAMDPGVGAQRAPAVDRVHAVMIFDPALGSGAIAANETRVRSILQSLRCAGVAVSEARVSEGLTRQVILDQVGGVRLGDRGALLVYIFAHGATDP